jgi:hypothetical protein
MAADLLSLYGPDFYKNANRPSLASARVCAPLILDLLRPASLVDIGCGQGEWLSVFADHGITDFHGVDGEYVADSQLYIPRQHFTRHDLTRPLDLGRRFDLALSLEVAEHLPHRLASAHIAGLVSLAPAVVFSAAIPGQGGINHLNEQWPWYWRELFTRHGFIQLDPFRHLLWQNPEVALYYKHNLFLYVDPAVHQSLIDRIGFPDEYHELTLVRTSMLKALTGPGWFSRQLSRVGRRLGRLVGRRSSLPPVPNPTPNRA